jgi:hypothetical protein
MRGNDAAQFVSESSAISLISARRRIWLASIRIGRYYADVINTRGLGKRGNGRGSCGPLRANPAKAGDAKSPVYGTEGPTTAGLPD